ncbi:MAG TPA: DUF3618 domain-containing protein [Solirubrobacteraceae bacterium]|nr:DUF3618 domain-containing protein [Solirubrobacteraceae bacterium]
MSTHEQTQDELRKEIDATRRELGETVEQLAAKTAVKARVHDRVEHAEDDLKDALERRPVRVAAVGGAAIGLLIVWALSRRAN